SDVAGRLEKVFPQFEDRLRSTVNFSGGHESGSAALQKRVMDQASQIAGTVDFNRAVVSRPATISVLSALGATLVVLTIMMGVLDRGALTIIASRLLTPFNAQSWPKRVQINLTSPVPARVPVGSKIDLTMKLERGDKASLKPILHYQLEDGPAMQVFMTRGNDGQFHASLDARLEQAMASGKLNAFIEAGDDRRDLSAITIVPRLSIKQITAQITRPAYVPKRDSVTQDLATAPAVMAEGSDVAISVRFNKALAAADMVLEPIGENTKPPAIKWTRSDDLSAVATMRALAPFRFRVQATDVDGFTNTALEEYELIVKPDANLSIQLENPRRSEERTPQAFVPLQATAEDDCGVEWVRLAVERLQPSPQKWEIPLVTKSIGETGVAWLPVDTTAERTRNRLNYQWELSTLKLTPGDVIEYQLLARDNFDLDGRRHEPVGTSKLRITIVSQEDLAARVTDDLRAVKSQIALVRQSQVRTKQETQQLAGDTKDKPALDPADRSAAERLAQQQSSTAASTKQLATRTQQSIDRLNENRSEANDLKDIAQVSKDAFERTSENPMKDAAQQLSTSAQAKQPMEDRQATLAAAQVNQQKALDDLDRAMAKMDNIGSLQSAIAEIAGILKDQQLLRKNNEEIAKTSLGKKPDQMTAQDREKLDATADKQAKLADRTQQAMEKMSKQSKQMERSDPASAEAMKSAAQKGQDAKVAPNQQRASQQTRENQQAGAQQSQQQVELGLESMLSELKEAERRELARLREELAKLQEQIATLVRRQSGHNLDNVLLQGPDKVKSLDVKVAAELIELSQRKPDTLKAPQARQLNSGQELTERNTRDIAKTADAQPKTVEIGALLTKAAGKMERAIVGLRGGSLADAYDPSQVEALATLLDARKQIDDQKNEADKKADQQQKDAIRARYVKIRDQQQKLNVDTVRVEKARDAQGNIVRTEWPTIARLPKDQFGLAEEVAKIEEDLQTLGSVVYVWANRDIKNTMDQVKDDLTASKTAIATQSEQVRVVEQLDAMIANLAERLSEQKFESNAGAGGGGGGGNKPIQMPTASELGLLKSLQVAINKSTVNIHAAPEKDKPKLVGLGNRQGELRNLLDSVLKKATQDQMKLDAEPDNKDQLPEEAKIEDVDQKELEDALLGGDAGQAKIEQDFRLVGTRMARSRQRLAINADPGKVTQEIQGRIIKDMDKLIDQACKAQSQQTKQGSGQMAGKKPDGAQAPSQGTSTASSAAKAADAKTNTNSAGAGSKPQGLKDIRESAAEWGAVTPRMRDAVIESKGETVVEQYRKLIEDYYSALSKEGGRRDQ
ncbi:MAG: hypothetical protein H7144_13715, partial [Burkholderiales bacterium]|nr:hypothetical protein [Phycisphaerae bacterium]